MAVADKRRKHHKITKELPKALVDEVNRLIVGGATYDEITEFIKEEGFKVGRSSVGRYSKDFLTRLERLRVVRDQAKAIVEDDPDAPATQMAEAANNLAMQLVMEVLMEADIGNLKEEKLSQVLKAAAQLQRSSVAIEKLKMEFNKGVKAATEKLKEELKRELNADPELLKRLEVLVEKTRENIIAHR